MQYIIDGKPVLDLALGDKKEKIVNKLSFEEWCESLGLVKDYDGRISFGPSHDAAVLLSMWAKEKGYDTEVVSNNRGWWCVEEPQEYKEDEE